MQYFGSLDRLLINRTQGLYVLDSGVAISVHPSDIIAFRPCATLSARCGLVALVRDKDLATALKFSVNSHCDKLLGE